MPCHTLRRRIVTVELPLFDGPFHAGYVSLAEFSTRINMLLKATAGVQVRPPSGPRGAARGRGAVGVESAKEEWYAAAALFARSRVSVRDLIHHDAVHAGSLWHTRAGARPPRRRRGARLAAPLRFLL